MPTLLIKPSAEKDIRDLPAAVRLRVGDYRVLYECDAGTQTITIYRVKHRRDAYR